MLEKSDREILDVIRFLSARGIEAGYLVPTETGLQKSIMDAHAQLAGYLRRAGLHDYRLQPKGTEAKALIKTWLVKDDGLVETKSSLYRPETNGDPRIWIYELPKHVVAGNLLAIFAHEGELYVVNTSIEGLLQSASDPSSPFGHVLDFLTAAKNKPLDDRFSEWNLRLLRSFFSEASRGEEVFLRVDKEILDQIGQDIGGDAGFLEAIRTGPTWVRSSSLTQRILELVGQRRLPARNYKDPGHFDATYRGLRAPTYLPYLAALVRNDSINQSGYYQGLQADLKLQHQFGPNEMERVESAWEDLEAWTKSNNDRFGFFRLRRLGGYRLIGVPRSQSILKPSDVEDLARVFVQAHIRPGQDLSDGKLALVLDEARSAQASFTAAFQRALGIPDFEQPILATIRSAYSDWDGTLPARSSSGNAPGHRETERASGASIGLCLSVVGDEPLELSPHWWLPALQDSGNFRLMQGGTTWDGAFAGTEGAATGLAADKAMMIWSIAERAYGQAMPFDIECTASDGSEPTKASLDLPEKKLWILSPSFDGPTGAIELREGELPGSGQAYLLASPRNAGLNKYLDREKPPHEIIVAEGIPKDWLLVCLHECATLTDDQRRLPDGEDAHPKPRAIRFIGGRSVRRGYSRMYLPYDLPSIELDAPEGTRMVCPDGLRLVEEKIRSSQGIFPPSQFKPRKRFKVELGSSNSAAYEIKAMKGSEILSQAKLRIAGLSGELVETGQPFSLDSLGNPMASHEGLSGVLPPPDPGEPAFDLVDQDVFEVSVAEIGTPANLVHYQNGAREFFLDALAQFGSIDYGTARDQILRLQQGTGNVTDPPLFLLDLRSRGHLEISTTSKGHMSRVHAVAPTIYELPVSSAGKRAYGVTGTLRLTHWDQIASESHAWTAYRIQTGDNAFKPLRLLFRELAGVEAICEQLGLRFSSAPAAAIAAWSAPVDFVRGEALRNPMESIGDAREGAIMFNPSKGRFTAQPSGNQYRQLWKVRDLDTGMDNIYVLHDQGRFAFVRDRNWGRWIALDAFAKFVSDMYQVSGVHPMPISYSSSDRTLWLPARLNLPFALERALTLCSGDAPNVLDLRSPADTPDAGRIPLATKSSIHPLLAVNRFYNDMAIGKWLAYRWVPEQIASSVADKLGATLDTI